MSAKQSKINNVLISVYDKTDLIPFAEGLVKSGAKLISTGNTAKTLQDAGLEVTKVSDVTGFPEILDGRVKTLHPRIHGGILARGSKEHLDVIKKHKIPQIDLVVISLYPFEQTIAKGAKLQQAIEMIDIGGPTMLRAAAKNHERVGVVCDREDYDRVLSDLNKNKGTLSLGLRKELALKVFRHTAAYDAAIGSFLARESRQLEMPDRLAIGLQKAGSLRYGENPHQNAAVYTDISCPDKGLTQAKILHGKELSYNNYLDLDAAWSLVSAFKETSATVIKHNNPCGFSSNKDAVQAFKKAFEGDPLSAFGGIVGVNVGVDSKLAEAIYAAGFLECVIAPKFDKGALGVLTKKKNLRLVQMPNRRIGKSYDVKRIAGGLLLQEINRKEAKESQLKIATRKKPTKAQMDDLLLAFRLCRFVKSNAIVLMKNRQAVGIGMGQPSRVDSADTAFKKAGKKAVGAVLASDGFFPKPDSIELAAKNGIKAIIQPGGSIQDPVIIDACNKAGIAMVLTGFRHFTH